MRPSPTTEVAASQRAARFQLGVILAAYLALAIGYSHVTPPWNNPDEPAHYAYVEYLVTQAGLPELRPGDWDAQALERLKQEARFSSDSASLRGATYEYHQPPLYYFLSAPAYLLTANRPLAVRVRTLRLVSTLLGVASVVVAHGATRTAFPGRPELAAAVAGVVAFVPMFTAISAAVSNDALAILLGSCAIWLMLVLVRDRATRGRALLAGVLGGLLLLTKLTVYIFAPLLVLAVGMASLRRSSDRRDTLPLNLGICIVAVLAVSGWWFVRNGLVYGAADPLGSARHDTVVVGQLRWSETGLTPIAAWWAFGQTLFRSYWAQFGWMGIVVSARLYWLYFALCALGSTAVSAALVTAVRQGSKISPAWFVLGLSTLVVCGEVVYYNLSFVQPQGRYLYPAILPLSALTVVGWAEVGRPRGSTPRALFPAAVGWGWTAAAFAVAAEYLLGTAEGALGITLPLAVAALAGAVALLRPVPSLARFALPSLVAALGALDLACLVGFVERYFAG